ncbi:unnamed protein product [Angiostrongylus costaricensis]|uniref:Transmembrane protein 182 n=1 Tax=Angiostrongylus costaricensis TaxID=334426 RepID=A0A158PD26_ANGCS|nr:unnamed protein product [Angiostrongylus costaricensis]
MKRIRKTEHSNMTDNSALGMVDLKQQLNAIDYFGVVAVWLSFFSIIFIISVTCILWCCVSKDDDSTVFAKFPLLSVSLGFHPENVVDIEPTSDFLLTVWHGSATTSANTGACRVSFVLFR